MIGELEVLHGLELPRPGGEQSSKKTTQNTKKSGAF
jgi:hypothetical protein